MLTLFTKFSRIPLTGQAMKFCALGLSVRLQKSDFFYHDATSAAMFFKILWIVKKTLRGVDMLASSIVVSSVARPQFLLELL